MYVKAKGCRVYYQQAGSGEPLLLLHGWGVTGEVFKPLFMNLARRRFVRVIDFPGFGLSERPPNSPTIWGAAEYAEMLLELLDKWGWGKADILAHSFGARIALRFADAYPQRVGRLLLTGAAGIRMGKRVPIIKRIVSRLGKVVGIFGPPGRWLKDRLYRFIGSADYLSAGPMRPVFVKVVNDDLSGILPGIDHETLLVWGENDDATPLEDGRKMKSLLKNSHLEVIPGAGHYAFAEKPELFLYIAEQFFGIAR